MMSAASASLKAHWKNAYLGDRRSGASCENGGPHSGYRHLADKTAMAGGRHEG
jgi:hypothetical protein